LDNASYQASLKEIDILENAQEIITNTSRSVLEYFYLKYQVDKMALHIPNSPQREAEQWLVETFSFDIYDKKLLLSKRYLIWLCFTLETLNHPGYFINHNTHDITERLCNLLQNQQHTIHAIKTKMSSQLIATDNFDWITNNTRQLNWIKDEISTPLINNLPPPNYSIEFRNLFNAATAKIPPRDLLIFLFDINEPSSSSFFSTKKSFVSSVNESWTKYKSKTDKIFKWISSEEQEEEETIRCKYLYDQFSKEHMPFHYNLPVFQSKEDTLIFMDRWVRFLPHTGGNNRRSESVDILLNSVELLIKKCQRRRNQNRYRDNLENKKQLNLVLPTTGIEKLDLLARNYGLSRSEVVEVLIKLESEKRSYLTEFSNRLKAKQKLLKDGI
jgi:hypothetical protein